MPPTWAVCNSLLTHAPASRGLALLLSKPPRSASSSLLPSLPRYDLVCCLHLHNCSCKKGQVKNHMLPSFLALGGGKTWRTHRVVLDQVWAGLSDSVGPREMGHLY